MLDLGAFEFEFHATNLEKANSAIHEQHEESKKHAQNDSNYEMYWKHDMQNFVDRGITKYLELLDGDPSWYWGLPSDGPIVRAVKAKSSSAA